MRSPAVDPWVPLGAALLTYHRGNPDAVLRVESDVFDTETVPVDHYYRPDDKPLPQLEMEALARAAGTVLDVGAGAGRHATDLQDRGHRVTALDISADAVRVMRDRGVRCPVLGDVFRSDLGTYDTVLLMMNGIGVAGNLDGLTRLLRRLTTCLNPGGRIIADAASLEPEFELGLIRASSGRAFGDPTRGEVAFRLGFGKLVGSWYPWIFPGRSDLERLAVGAGLEMDVIAEGARGTYLVEMRIAP